VFASARIADALESKTTSRDCSAMISPGGISDPETLDRAARVERLRAAREIGRIALSAISRSMQVIDGPAVLEKIARLNAAVVRDDVVEQTLAAGGEFVKLFTVATRVAAVAAEIESQDLPGGWSIQETLLQRTYRASSGPAEVTVNKDYSDPGRLDIKLHGQRVWSGYEGEEPGYMPLSAAFRKAEELLEDPTLSSHPLDEYAALRRRHTDTSLEPNPVDTTEALVALRAIRAQAARLDEHEEAPTGDDYNRILDLALEALRTLENPQHPDDPLLHRPQADTTSQVREDVLGSLREVALAWQASADLFRRFLPGKRMIVLDRNGLAFAERGDDSPPRFKLERPYPGLFGISLMNRKTAVAVRSQLAAHAPESGPFVLTDAFKFAESKVRRACKLLEQLEHTGEQRLTLNAPSQLSAGPLLPPDGGSGRVRGDAPSRPLQTPALNERLVDALHRTAAWLENALEAEPEDINPSEIGPVLGDVRDALNAAEISSLGINPAIMTPAEETITFHVWHGEDNFRGLAPERAKVELEISAGAASQRPEYIEQARTALRDLFSTLWDFPAIVFTEQEFAEVTGEAEAPQP
jgi:hypothetical protein